jgi:predicted nucleotidyltransferase
MLPLIEEKRHQLVELCRAYRVTRLDLFGSAATEAFDSESSDLDFIAQFEGTRERDYAERFVLFAEALEALFGRPVDLLTERMIRNPIFREEVEKSRRRVVEIAA